MFTDSLVKCGRAQRWRSNFKTCRYSQYDKRRAVLHFTATAQFMHKPNGTFSNKESLLNRIDQLHMLEQRESVSNNILIDSSRCEMSGALKSSSNALELRRDE